MTGLDVRITPGNVIDENACKSTISAIVCQDGMQEAGRSSSVHPVLV
jgi:hypothetical protein